MFPPRVALATLGMFAVASSQLAFKTLRDLMGRWGIEVDPKNICEPKNNGVSCLDINGVASPIELNFDFTGKDTKLDLKFVADMEYWRGLFSETPNLQTLVLVNIPTAMEISLPPSLTTFRAVDCPRMSTNPQLFFEDFTSNGGSSAPSLQSLTLENLPRVRQLEMLQEMKEATLISIINTNVDNIILPVSLELHTLRIHRSSEPLLDIEDPSFVQPLSRRRLLRAPEATVQLPPLNLHMFETLGAARSLKELSLVNLKDTILDPPNPDIPFLAPRKLIAAQYGPYYADLTTLRLENCDSLEFQLVANLAVALPSLEELTLRSLPLMQGSTDPVTGFEGLYPIDFDKMSRLAKLELAGNEQMRQLNVDGQMPPLLKRLVVGNHSSPFEGSLNLVTVDELETVVLTNNNKFVLTVREINGAVAPLLFLDVENSALSGVGNFFPAGQSNSPLQHLRVVFDGPVECELFPFWQKTALKAASELVTLTVIGCPFIERLDLVTAPSLQSLAIGGAVRPGDERGCEGCEAVMLSTDIGQMGELTSLSLHNLLFDYPLVELLQRLHDLGLLQQLAVMELNNVGTFDDDLAAADLDLEIVGAEGSGLERLVLRNMGHSLKGEAFQLPNRHRQRLAYLDVSGNELTNVYPLFAISPEEPFALHLQTLYNAAKSAYMARDRGFDVPSPCHAEGNPLCPWPNSALIQFCGAKNGCSQEESECAAIAFGLNPGLDIGSCSSAGDGDDPDIIGPVIDVNVNANTTTNDTTFVFEIPYDDAAKDTTTRRIEQNSCVKATTKCEWQDPETKQWSDSGCSYKELGVEAGLPGGQPSGQCTCTHLTVFALVVRGELDAKPLCHAQELDYALSGCYGLVFMLVLAQIARLLLAKRAVSAGDRAVVVRQIIQHTSLLLACVFRLCYLLLKPVIGSGLLVLLALLPSFFERTLLMYLALTWASMKLFKTMTTNPFARLANVFRSFVLVDLLASVAVPLAIELHPKPNEVGNRDELLLTIARTGSLVLTVITGLVCVCFVVCGMAVAIGLAATQKKFRSSAHSAISDKGQPSLSNSMQALTKRLVIVSMGTGMCLAVQAALFTLSLDSGALDSTSATLAISGSFHVLDLFCLLLLLYLFKDAVDSRVRFKKRFQRESTKGSVSVTAYEYPSKSGGIQMTSV